MEEVADRIFTNANVITVDPVNTIAQAVAVKKGKISAVGSNSEILAMQGPGTEVVDLEGRTLIPGFIDAHSHLMGVAVTKVTAFLFAPPIGPVDTIEKLQHALREYRSLNHIKPGDWIIGMGYDDTGLKEMRHPTRDDLDAVSRENPIYIIHSSGHMGVANSLALQKAGITSDSKDPEGGRIQHRPGSNEPDGVLEEHAQLPVMSILPKPSLERSKQIVRQGLEYYASLGITTAQEGSSSVDVDNVYRAMADAGELSIDIVSYPFFLDKGEDYAEYPSEHAYHNGFRIGGVKFVLDGSIQGYTAYLKEPYYTQPGGRVVSDDACGAKSAGWVASSEDTPTTTEEHTSDGYRGYPAITDQSSLNVIVSNALANGWPILAHANGDAAIDQFVEAIRHGLKLYPRDDHRTTLIHAQTIRDDQLDACDELGIGLSFFIGHVYYWGDRHRDIFLGPERANRLDPARSALERRLPVTLHSDAPVSPQNIIDLISFAVNRTTPNGRVLGADESLTPIEALKAVTINAARQYFEEGIKGSIEVGKNADLVVLSDDPTRVDPDMIRQIEVLQTIKNGSTIFQKQPSEAKVIR